MVSCGGKRYLMCDDTISPPQAFKSLWTFGISELSTVFCQYDGQESFGNLNLKGMEGAYCPQTIQFQGLESEWFSV